LSQYLPTAFGVEILEHVNVLNLVEIRPTPVTRNSMVPSLSQDMVGVSVEGHPFSAACGGLTQVVVVGGVVDSLLVDSVSVDSVSVDSISVDSASVDSVSVDSVSVDSISVESDSVASVESSSADPLSGAFPPLVCVGLLLVPVAPANFIVTAIFFSYTPTSIEIPDLYLAVPA
jgi:hypothetical protein